MLRGVDTTLEVIAWSLVVFFVILLFVGPRVVAEDKPEAKAANAAGGKVDQDAGDVGAGDQAGREATVDGKTVFSDTCGGCHTLSAAGTSGTTGPTNSRITKKTTSDQAMTSSVVSSPRSTVRSPASRCCR